MAKSTAQIIDFNAIASARSDEDQITPIDRVIRNGLKVKPDLQSELEDASTMYFATLDSGDCNPAERAYLSNFHKEFDDAS